MKYLYSFLIAWAIGLSAWAQSGVDYNPENPADPSMPPTPVQSYTLTMETAPRYGGSVNNSVLTVEAGKEMYCRAYERTGYTFKQWMVGDSLVSTNSSFYFVMPAKDVVLTAYFDYVGYDPENPDDPFADGYVHKVALYATPSVGGYFNSASFTLTENEETNIYAYPREGYRFSSWKQNGKIVSTENPLTIKMGTKDLEYTATFVYDPESPGNPSPNNFNPVTGELIIDEFVSGNLNSAIYSVLGDNDYSLVQSVTVVGKMNSYDFGFANNLYSCTLIDLARTTGYTEVPSWAFDSNAALTKVVLPASVGQISRNAFYGCENLSEIVCYALIPPTVNSNAFNNILEGVVVRVPSSVLSQYSEADGWKNFTLLPLDEETCAIGVSLPADATDGRYKNMTLELNNISSGQVLKYLITDRVVYSFANLVRDTKYNLYVKNASGAVLGSILDIEIGEENVDVVFESLLQPKDVTLKVVASDNADVTQQTTITWFDEEGKYLNQGAVLKGVLEGVNVNCRIALSKDLAMQYAMPENTEYTVVPSDNSIVVQLAPFSEVNLSGVVKDITTESPISNATVTISQLLNGKYSKSVVVRTDNTGTFNATVYDAACDIVVTANDYVSKTFELAHLADSAVLNSIFLKGITGVRINAQLTFAESVAEGETSETQNGYDDYANISYSIYNKTAQKEITNFNVQTPYIVLLEEVEPDDVLSITASSRTGSFKDVTVLGVVDVTNRVSVTIPIVELGELQANYKQSNSSKIVGVLYNSKGELLKKSSYADASISFSDLEDGAYTLVTMESSSFFNSILNLKDLTNAGLIEGTHFVKNDISVQSGKITTLTIDNVPEFDDSQFYYTGSNTQFTVNKQSVTVGNYVTLRAKVDFKKEYANGVSDVKLVFDLPESCSFVDNSVLTGNGTGSYSVSENRIIVDLANINDVVRFCVTPTDGGTCRPSAFAQFNVNGKEVLQPIGTASFEAELMKISVPQVTSSTYLVVKGTATSNSKVRIFDNGILVGTTNSLANGQWSSKIELYKPYSKSYHSIYAEIVSSDGQFFITEVKTLEYDKTYVSLSKITMIHNGTTIVFDPIERKSSTNTYTYVPGKDLFTFTAEYSNKDTSLVKNLEFVILASDGTSKRIPATYNGQKNLWVAQSAYSNSSKLPVNVTVDYTFTGSTPLYDETQETDQRVIFDNLIKNMLSSYEAGDVSLLINTEEELYFSVVPNGFNSPEYFRVRQENYDDIIEEYKDENTFAIVNDSTDCGAFQEFGEEYYKLVFWNNKTQESFSLNYTGINADGVNQRFLPALISGVAGVAMAVGEYYIGLPEIESWYQTIDMEIEKWNKNGNRILDFLYATCEDGSYKIKDLNKIEAYRASIDEWWRTVEQYIKDFKAIVDLEKKNHKDKCTLKGAISVGLSAVGGVISGIKMAFQQPVLLGVSGKTVGTVSESLVPAANTAANETLSQGMGLLLGEAVNAGYPRMTISNWYTFKSKQLVDFFCNTIQSIKNDYSSCKKEEKDDEGGNGGPFDKYEVIFPYPPLVPAIDPSGYVYEGVSSNRIEGVMASCYYKETVEDMYGDLHENVVLWDAEQYAQENPLFTDENGMYRWDVPQGLWQVKFEKEGYQTTYSEWLPVPPPQLEVNIAMTQNKQPEVKAARAYEDGIEVEFDKYMQLDGLTTENIFVTKNGETAAGTVTLLNEEQAYEDNPVKYASKVRFVPETSFLTTDEVTLTVSRKVKSYAGIQMGEDYTQSFDIEKEVKSIVADSLIKVAYNGDKEITVSALPYDAAIGKKMIVKNSSSMIATISADTLTFDENGQASLTLNGDLPGTAMLTFTLAETDVKALSTVQVVIPELKMTAAPKATRASGTAVYRGTEVGLTCETEGAVIYYTLDGSCPCDENAPRKVYESPIVITEDMTLKAMAVVEEGDESEVAEFSFTIKRTNLGLELKEGWNWVSHNMETEVPTTALPQNATRIVGQTAELVNDPVYGLMGNLKTLQPDEAYKVQMATDSIHVMSGYEFNPATNIDLKSGWNWLGYPVNQTMSLSEAFANMQPDNEDYIVGQDGFAQYADGTWTGTLLTLNPGMGYLYHSQSDKSFAYNSAIVSKARAVYGRGIKNETPWAVDKNKYPDVMPLVADVYVDGQKMAAGNYAVGAFCGTECRGVGKYVNGRLMMNIYGEANEKITFRAVNNETEEMFDIVEQLAFTETLQGSLYLPYALNVGDATGIAEGETAWKVWPAVPSHTLYLSLNGNGFDRVTLTDAYGNIVLLKEHVEDGEAVNVAPLADGVYIVTAEQNGKMFYKKIMKIGK